METEERPTKMRKLSHEPAHVVTPATHVGGSNGAIEASTARQDAGADEHAKPGSTTSPAQPGAGSIKAGGSDTGLLAGTTGAFVTQPEAASIESHAMYTETQTAGTLEDTSPAPTDVAPILSSQPTETADPPISKSQMKKLRRKEDWEAKRDDRKIKRKEKVVQKRERKRAEREDAVAKGEPIPQKEGKQVRSVQLPITFIIDCDFDDLMRDNERISLSGQVTRSYHDNKIAPFKAHLAISSFGGKLRERFDGLLAKHYESWKGVRFLDGDFVEAAEQAQEWMKDSHGGKLAGPVFGRYAEAELAQLREQGETIYLSSDSDYTLTELKPYSTYIIGGLVDKNREKGICHKRAVQKGIKTARLPIGDYLDMASRKVLATNHVNEIMLSWLELGDWGEAFMKVIPKRKGGQLKGQAAGQEDDDGPGDDGPGDGRPDDGPGDGRPDDGPPDNGPNDGPDDDGGVEDGLSKESKAVAKRPDEDPTRAQ